MLRVAFLSYTLILPALFAPAVAGQLDFGAENLNLVAENAQLPLGQDYRLVCHSIARSISPASQVFPPGAVFTLLSELLPTAYVEPQTLLNSRWTSLIGSTRVHRYPRAPCGLVQRRTSA
jgi:hypothetical protein